MSRQFFAEMISWATADGTAVANTVTETILYPNVTIPANYLQDGRTLRLRVLGKYSTTGTPTMLFSVRWGGVAGTIITKSAAITGGSAVTNALWDLDILLNTRVNGSTGNVMGNGKATIHSATAATVGSATGAPGISPMTNGGITAPASASIDLTADTALAITLTWGTASASNTATALQYTLESLN